MCVYILTRKNVYAYKYKFIAQFDVGAEKSIYFFFLFKYYIWRQKIFLSFGFLILSKAESCNTDLVFCQVIFLVQRKLLNQYNSEKRMEYSGQ